MVKQRSARCCEHLNKNSAMTNGKDAMVRQHAARRGALSRRKCEVQYQSSVYLRIACTTFEQSSTICVHRIRIESLGVFELSVLIREFRQQLWQHRNHAVEVEGVSCYLWHSWLAAFKKSITCCLASQLCVVCRSLKRETSNWRGLKPRTWVEALFITSFVTYIACLQPELPPSVYCVASLNCAMSEASVSLLPCEVLNAANEDGRTRRNEGTQTS